MDSPAKTSSPTIVWFYQDLRLSDHEALSRAAARGPVLPLYIDDDLVGFRDGGASRWWLHQALKGLAADLAAHQAALILKRGQPLAILRVLIEQTGAGAVTWSRRYEPALAARDAKIIAALEKDGIEVTVTAGFLLFEPERIATKSGTMFKVYTPFSKACFAAPAPGACLPPPKRIDTVKGVSGDDLDAWKLVPKSAQWPAGLQEAWLPGETPSHQRMQAFIADILGDYKNARQRPDQDGSSRMSPYLHFGHVSPRQLWHGVSRARAHQAHIASSAERYLLELLWREFCWHLLHHVPDLTAEPLQKSFAAFPWRSDAEGLQTWQKGQTGYPIVDAGMRQLWRTGWMHNRVRMIVGSFLIKDLLIDWRKGMEWFWDTLVDADLGNNTANWQWVAGCGADASPYYRVFNPTLQGEKFDPKGDYVRQYVPELAKLDAASIHQPWNAPPEILKKAGITLGKTYPRPMVDHAKARLRALAALKGDAKAAAQSAETGDLFD